LENSVPDIKRNQLIIRLILLLANRIYLALTTNKNDCYNPDFIDSNLIQMCSNIDQPSLPDLCSYDTTRCMARKWDHPELGPGFGDQCRNHPKPNSEFCGRHAAQIKNPKRCKECSQKDHHPVVHTYQWECRGRVTDTIPNYFKCPECKVKLKYCKCNNDTKDLSKFDQYSTEVITAAMDAEGDSQIVEAITELLLEGSHDELEQYLRQREVGQHSRTNSSQDQPGVPPPPTPNVGSLVGIIINGKIMCTDVNNNLFTFSDGDYHYQGKYTYPD
jgi:hypothetical protein